MAAVIQISYLHGGKVPVVEVRLQAVARPIIIPEDLLEDELSVSSVQVVDRATMAGMESIYGAKRQNLGVPVRSSKRHSYR